jgi:hypothetical protein
MLHENEKHSILKQEGKPDSSNIAAASPNPSCTVCIINIQKKSGIWYFLITLKHRVPIVTVHSITEALWSSLSWHSLKIMVNKKQSLGGR